jgi:hypothetical protein
MLCCRKRAISSASISKNYSVAVGILGHPEVGLAAIKMPTHADAQTAVASGGK